MTTATPVTPGLDLLGDGKTITLLDGSLIPLRYSMRSLALLEAKFGSVANIQTAIDSSGRGAAFGPIIDLIGPGTIGLGGFEPHIREHVDGKGNRSISSIAYRRKRDGLELGELMGPNRMGEHVEAMARALNEALGGGQGNDPAPEQPGVTTSSLGLTSTTSPSAPSTSPLMPSGA